MRYTIDETRMPTQKILSVRSKILFSVVASIVAFSILVYVISTSVLLESYRSLEKTAMEQNLSRAHDAIKEFENQQMIKLSDWAAWDEAYTYARDRDETWANETIYVTGLANLDINMMLFTDPEGKNILLRTADIETRTEAPQEELRVFFDAHTDLITFASLEEETSGLVVVSGRPMFLVSLPLRTSEGKGPSTGSISFGRYLDAGKVKDFGEVTHLDVSLFSYNDTNAPPDVQAAQTRLLNGAKEVIDPKSDERIVGYTFVHDVYGEPILVLRVETPRPIFTQGLITLYTYLGIGGGALLLFGLLILMLLDRLVISRLVFVSRDVEKINDVKDLSIRLAGGEKDEIGRLADKINQMLSWLSEARKGEAASRREIVNLLDELKREKEQREEMEGLLGKGIKGK